LINNRFKYRVNGRLSKCNLSTGKQRLTTTPEPTLI
jgi:hypothetical protein